MLMSFLSDARSAAHPALLRRAMLVFVLGGMVILMAACLPLLEKAPADGAESAASMDATEEALVGQATADLAEQLGVDADAIEVTSIEAVEWGDSSLGCPEEGMMYAAVITPGYQIMLTYDDVDYVYHPGADADSPIIGCTKDEEVVDGEAAEADTEPAAGSTEETLVTLATEDLAAQLGVDVDDIKVTSVEAMDWHDSSLGCPQEGMMYAQMITPGYQITLIHEGDEYVYHTGADADGPVINCTETETEEAAAPAGDTGETTPMSPISDSLVALAKEDLAQREGVDPDEIEVKSVQAVEWRDGSLGCAKAGMMYPQVITPGYRITLTVNGVDYAYHTGGRAGGPVKYCDAPQKSDDDGTYQTK